LWEAGRIGTIGLDSRTMKAQLPTYFTQAGPSGLREELLTEDSLSLKQVLRRGPHKR